jgi:hypothetical protein
VEENNTLVMEAQLAPGIKPKPTVKWLRDGKELQADDHLKLSEEADGSVHKMTILRTQPGDKGRITLLAENQFGKAGQPTGRKRGDGQWADGRRKKHYSMK